jgi:hypothetical protein
MKPVFQVLVAIIVIFAIGALVLSFSLDGIVKSNLESTTGEMLGTSVEISDVDISILDGTGTIEEFTIHNPEGFSDNPALRLQQINIEIDLSTLLSDTIVVNSIEITQPNLFFEQKVEGNNFNALIEKLDETEPSDINLVVDYLLVEEGQITLTSDIGEEKSVQGKLDRFELTDIGREGNNTMEQTLQQILEPLLKRAAREAVEQDLLDVAREKLQDLLEN